MVRLNYIHLKEHEAVIDVINPPGLFKSNDGLK